MSLGVARLHVRVVGSIRLSEPSFSRYSSLEAGWNFVHSLLLKFIRAARSEKSAGENGNGDDACHPFTLEALAFIARKWRLRIDRIGHKEAEMIEPEILLQGYRLGVFPMAREDGAIEWFSPDPRGIIPLTEFHVPHGLRRVLRKQIFEIRVNTCFSAVMRCCADRDDTWINDEIFASYIRLHELGYAHSVEAWSDGELVGGLYGVAVGGAFFGESMFHRATDASKVALVALVERLRARKFVLLDTQWTTEHLEQFGVMDIPRQHYVKLLAEAVQLSRSFV